jgi:hypothetical protein
VKLVLDELEGAGLLTPHDPPRVWWIGSGITSPFPFHAAGADFEHSTNNTLSHLVPSYTFSIKALTHSKSQVLRWLSDREHGCQDLGPRFTGEKS